MIHHSRRLSRLGRQIRNGRESTNWEARVLVSGRTLSTEGATRLLSSSSWVGKQLPASGTLSAKGLAPNLTLWVYRHVSFHVHPSGRGTKKSPFRGQSMTLPLHSGESVSPWAADNLEHA
jgi:hypothetical protein